MEKMPLSIQMTRAMLMDPVAIRTPPGATKMPDPMMQPMMTLQPWMRPMVAFNSTSDFSPVPGDICSTPFDADLTGEWPLVATAEYSVLVVMVADQPVSGELQQNRSFKNQFLQVNRIILLQPLVH